jgi:cytochrome P450
MTTRGPVVDFDHHSPEFAVNRDAILADLRTRCPVAYTEHHDGYWVVTSFELARQVLGDPLTFSSEKADDGSGGDTIPSVGPRLIPAECDPPYHDALRRALNPMFTRPASEALRSTTEDIVTGLIDRVIDKGEFDLVHDVGDVLPATLTVIYLGFPPEQRIPFIRSIQASLSMEPKTDGDLSGMESFANACQAILALIDARRAEPRDDLVSYLATHEDPSFDDEELLWIVFTLLVAGFENTAALITNALIHLAQDRPLRDRLIAEPGLIGKATEEFLRFYTPGVSLARTVVQDVELGGVPLKKGDRVLVALPAANHDETAFPQGGTFDVDRASRSHVAFGYGPHYCLGAWLARMEWQVLCREVLRRIPDYEVHLDRAERFSDAGIMNGWKTVPASIPRRESSDEEQP